MFFTSLFIGISLIFGAIGQDGNFCVPNPVTNLTVSRNATLDWSAPDDNCSVSFYVINILGEGGVIFHYDAPSPIFNISFLPVCEPYNFTVTPISEANIQGIPATIAAQVQPGADENLTVSAFTVWHTNRTGVRLEWEMNGGVHKCFKLYRVVVWDDDGNIPHDVYVEDNNFAFIDAVPCMRYEFGIRPIFDPEEDGPLSLYNYTHLEAPTTPPVLAAISEGVTSINMTWILEPYQENRCHISAIDIDASPNFNISHFFPDGPDRGHVAFEILNLEPNTIYISHVSVVNSAGLSEPVTLPFQTLPNSTIFL